MGRHRSPSSVKKRQERSIARAHKHMGGGAFPPNTCFTFMNSGACKDDGYCAFAHPVACHPTGKTFQQLSHINPWLITGAAGERAEEQHDSRLAGQHPEPLGTSSCEWPTACLFRSIRSGRRRGCLTRRRTVAYQLYPQQQHSESSPRGSRAPAVRLPQPTPTRCAGDQQPPRDVCCPCRRWRRRPADLTVGGWCMQRSTAAPDKDRRQARQS
jgi:hypothetical protein